MRDKNRFPELYVPFPPALNDHADIAHEATVDWLDSFNLFVSEQTRRRFYATNIGRLAGRFHPGAPADTLQLLSDWYGWMFFWDDQRDESELGRQPYRLADENMAFLKILAGCRPEEGAEPLSLALWDLQRRLVAKTPSGAWMDRFIRSVAEHFDSTVWEATNRVQGLTPDIETYIEMRPVTGGLYVDAEFTEIAEGIRLSEQLRKHPIVQAANNVVCWANDLISFSKEIRRGDVHNLIVVLEKARGLKTPEAVDCVTAMHDAELQRFLKLEWQLPFNGDEVANAGLRSFSSFLRTRMRGNLDWSLESGRYGPTEDRKQPVQGTYYLGGG